MCQSCEQGQTRVNDWLPDVEEASVRNCVAAPLVAIRQLGLLRLEKKISRMAAQSAGHHHMYW
jgi:hypothetical protein